MTNISDNLTEQLGNLQTRSLVVGLILALGGLGYASAMGDMAHFYQSYLVGFMIITGITLVCMAFFMLHQLIGGRWGFLIQRLLEAAMSTFPILLILFIPIILGMHDLYHWTHEEAVATDPILQHKASYLNVSAFIIRYLIYFAIWIVISSLLIKWSNAMDESGDPTLLDKTRDVCGPGVVIFALTTTFASFDWIMSTDPHWFSTLYGVIMIVDAGGAALAFAIIMMAYLRNRDDSIAKLADSERFYDWGKLLLAFTLLWFYMMLSQFLIIWAANLPEENSWYIHRLENGWDMLTIGLVLGRFVISFFLLLSIPRKRNPRRLARVAVFILIMHLVDIFWHVVPNLRPEGFHIGLTDVMVPIGLGCIWFFFVINRLKKRPLIPQKDPRFVKIIESIS
jgi:hypothetical protein